MPFFLSLCLDIIWVSFSLITTDTIHRHHSPIPFTEFNSLNCICLTDSVIFARKRFSLPQRSLSDFFLLRITPQRSCMIWIPAVWYRHCRSFQLHKTSVSFCVILITADYRLECALSWHCATTPFGAHLLLNSGDLIQIEKLISLIGLLLTKPFTISSCPFNQIRIGCKWCFSKQIHWILFGLYRLVYLLVYLQI